MFHVSCRINVLVIMSSVRKPTYLKREHGLELKLLTQSSIKRSETVVFAYIWDYLNDLKLASGDNITYFDYVEGTTNGAPISRFLYAQVILGCVRNGHKHLRPVDKLDGGFLKTEYGGTLGLTVNKDAEDQIIITSVSVFSMPESFNHWNMHLRTDKVAYYMAMTGHPLSPDTAVSGAHVTDRKQGLLLALEKHTPTFFLFVCVMHIVDNVKHSIFMNQDIHLLIWKAARTTYPASYTKALEELHAIDSSIFDYLTQSLAETWVECTLSGARFGDLISNNAETCQSLTVKLREQNVLQLLSAVVNMTASNFRERKEKA
eukprot:g68120.t1